MNPAGKFLIIAGAALILIGVALLFYDKIPFVGKLPGDIVVRKKSFTVYAPLATSILLSLLLTLIFYIINHIKK